MKGYSTKQILDPWFDMPDNYDELEKVYRTLAKSAEELTPSGCGLASCGKFLDGCPQVLHRILHMWTVCEKVSLSLAMVQRNA